MPQPTASFAALQRLVIPPEPRQAWLREALDLRYPDTRDVEAWRAFAAASSALAQRHLPAAAFRQIREFFSPAGPDALLIENLPDDLALPPPPVDGSRPAAKSAVSEAVIAGLVEPHAEIFAYSNEKAGAPIHEIVPVPGKEEARSNAGRVAFPCHTDVAFLAPDFSPSGLILLGLRNPTAAATSVLFLDRVLEAAPKSLVESLSKPIFHHPAPASFELAFSATGPVLWRDESGTARVAVQTHAVQAANAEGRQAIAELRAVLAQLQPERVILGPGVALLFRNDRVLHGRDAFHGERWLQRAYFTQCSERFRERTGAGPGAFVFDACQLLRRPACQTNGGQKNLAPHPSFRHSRN
ncbi:MAG TPA: TauD/TfdA family dioxygenase [Bryobacteraceae bacterium]|nr:TauD/TfdA family dioxygenase [Bryobacteraceae bacterium]